MPETQPKRTVTIGADASELTSLLDCLVDRLNELGELPPGGVPDSFKDIVTLETDHGAAGAGELVMRLNPTDSFLRFASAEVRLKCRRLIYSCDVSDDVFGSQNRSTAWDAFIRSH